jgi:ornithine cyclodeaminase/alanine dehydrogenase-like protein (mu-crystallin family)
VSSELRVIGAQALRARLSMAAAIDALEEAFGTRDPGSGPLRTHVDTPAGSLLLMPATGEDGVGVKLVTLTPDNPGKSLPFIHATYVLFEPDTQAPVAVLDGGSLTALRTAAVSGLATRHLANEDASRLVLFGAGVQATAHLDAMRAVRPVRTVVVVSRSSGAAEALVERARASGLEASVGDPGAVAEADLVCTCTTSSTPLFEGNVLHAGAHVNAVGSYQPETRELDTETVRRARVVVETRGVAMEEAGDVLIPIAEGAIGPEHLVADLKAVVRGETVRRSPDEITVFKSVGMAFEDLAVARAVVDAEP